MVRFTGSNFEELTAKLRAAGLPDKTPCLVMSQSAGRAEQIHRTKLSELGADLASTPRFPESAVLIIGAVAGAVRPEKQFQFKGETLSSQVEARSAVAAS